MCYFIYWFTGIEALRNLLKFPAEDLGFLVFYFELISGYCSFFAMLAHRAQSCVFWRSSCNQASSRAWLQMFLLEMVAHC